MSLITRMKVLWYLSGLEFSNTVNDVEDTLQAKEIEKNAKFYRETLKNKRPATIVKDDPPEFFPNEEDNDNTSKQTPTD